MVRVKKQPSHVNSQQRDVSQNLQNVETNPYDQNVACSSGSTLGLYEERDDFTLIDLINDDEEGSETDSDEEYLPAPSYQRRQKLNSRTNLNVDDNIKDKADTKPAKKVREKKVEINYGEFNNVIDNCEFIVKIQSRLPNENCIHCSFGELSFEVVNFLEEGLPDTDSFWLYICKDSNHSAIYFEWSDEEVFTSNKKLKVKANVFKYFHIAGALDIDLWKGLNVQRYFQIVLHKFEKNVMFLNVYFLKTGLVNLQNSWDFHVGNKALSAVCSYFFDILPLENFEEKNLKHDIDHFYKSIKDYHKGKHYSDIDVQHSDLIPQLRPYQKEAVKWMLYQERIKGYSSFGSQLHPLFVEITCENSEILYYNRYGCFFVNNKPTEIEACPGGILADEMGLGKTVEVLACIMCHHREDIPKVEIMGNIPKVNNETASDSLALDSANNMPVLKTDVKALPKGRCSREKRKASCKVNYSMLDSVLDSDNEKTSNGNDPDYNSKALYNSSDSEKESYTLQNARERSKRKRTSQVDYSHFDSIDDESNSKRRKVGSPQKKGYDIDKEIFDDKILSVIEKVILEIGWDGVLSNYKKNGSHTEYRKFLKKRKSDPYYMMSIKERLNIQYSNSIAEYSGTIAVNRSVCKGFFDTKVKQKSYFECVCGSEDCSESDVLQRVQCTICSLWQHAECVQYNLDDPSRGQYICPHCWTTQAPVVSGATLIVSPSSISHQWVEEIDKHIKEKSLQVFVYNGVAVHGYIQPRSLASYDMVITTYETLRRELNYVDLPHSNSEAGRRFRYPKRFMATPSPLPCVEWWRVCLDEAQMVECITTKTAEMALRLSAVNRWCITGTPVQKTVNDLQGLLMFLGVDPYCVPQWWQRCLYNPYCQGKTKPLHEVMTKYMWRNSKKDVVHELDIPSQMEEIHWLNFTPVEEHFYERLHADCASEAIKQINKFPDRKIKLSSLDRKALSKLIHPLLRLRQACDHPQVVKGHFVGVNRKTLTMEQLLENLISKTKLEVEDAHRIIVASLNGLAALDIIKGSYVNAVDKYREILRSVEEHKANFKTDSLQQLHTLHNLAEILQAKHEGVQPTLRDDSLSEEASKIKEDYLKHHPQKILEAELECNQNSAAVEDHKRNLKSKIEWWMVALECLDKEFVMEVREELLSLYSRFEEKKCILFHIQSKVQLMQLLKAKMRTLETQRKDMISNVRELLKANPADIVNGAIDCHLRPTEVEVVPCVLCQKHEYFEEYERNLFFMKDAKHSRSTDRSKETQDMKNKFLMLETSTQGSWGHSEIERILKYLQTKSLGHVDQDVYEDSQTLFCVLQAMKKEFKNFRILWRAVFDRVSGLDEVNMATLRFRVRLPGEELPSTKEKKNDPAGDLERKAIAPTYVLEEAEVEQQELKLKSEKIVSENEMNQKLRHFVYLKNLKKIDFGSDGNANPEPCPVCQGELGSQWRVLLCGHSYCLNCIAFLIKKVACIVNGSVKCPMCRHPTRVKEIANVDIQSKEEKEEVKVSGSLSTKIGGIVRETLKIKATDPDAKILIFSTWNDVLDVIADGFSQNGITYRLLHANNKFQANLTAFKEKQEVTTLLMPISSGANGLNLIEARHVILVEPILNPAAEVQAIGRVHRIGQNKTTVVHRFIIHSTIEERMHKIIHPKYLESEDSKDDNSLNIEELYQLFARKDFDDDGGDRGQGSDVDLETYESDEQE